MTCQSLNIDTTISQLYGFLIKKIEVVTENGLLDKQADTCLYLLQRYILLPPAGNLLIGILMPVFNITWVTSRLTIYVTIVPRKYQY